MVVVVSFLYCAPTDGAINACIIWHSSAVLYKYLLYVYIIVHTQHFIFSYIVYRLTDFAAFLFYSVYFIFYNSECMYKPTTTIHRTNIETSVHLMHIYIYDIYIHNDYSYIY